MEFRQVQQLDQALSMCALPQPRKNLLLAPAQQVDMILANVEPNWQQDRSKWHSRSAHQGHLGQPSA
eukprot:8714613-Karenia_brevis.AAC.1